MINRDPDLNKDPLKPYVFEVARGQNVPQRFPTPYGKWLEIQAEMVEEIRDEARERIDRLGIFKDVIRFPEKPGKEYKEQKKPDENRLELMREYTNRRLMKFIDMDELKLHNGDIYDDLDYANKLEKALEQVKNGNFEGAMRFLFESFIDHYHYSNSPLDYEDMPTPEEARAIFMKMGEEVYEDAGDLVNLRGEIQSLWNKIIQNTPEGTHDALKYLVAFNDDKEVLKQLEQLIPMLIHNLQGYGDGSPFVKEGETENAVKLVYKMMRLEEVLNKQFYGKEVVSANEKEKA
ncbi:hypothetical protein ACFL3T_01640 [Patescibacteria group bacterium]